MPHFLSSSGNLPTLLLALVTAGLFATPAAADPPEFIPDTYYYSGDLSDAQGSHLLTVYAIDFDGDPIYFILYDVNGYFWIDASQGKVYAHSHVQPGYYTLMVEAVDSTFLSGFATIYVEIIPDETWEGQSPVITQFSVYNHGYGLWSIIGVVEDDSEMVVIMFGDILEGQSTLVNSEGTFWHTTTIGEHIQGYISLQAIDSDGNRSDTRYYLVLQY